MLKNLVINFKGLRKKERDEAKLVLYKGPIKKMYISDINLEDRALIPTIKTEISHNNSLFYPSYEGYVNLDFKCILPDITEAESFINHLLETKNKELIGLLLSPNNTPDRKEKLLKYLKRISSYIYYDEDDLIPSHNITEKQFQKIKVPKNTKNPF